MVNLEHFMLTGKPKSTLMANGCAMKLRIVLAIATLLASCPPTFGKTLKPDRVISITSLQHLGNNKGKS